MKLRVAKADLCLVGLLCFRSTCNGIERSSPSHHTINLVYIYIYRESVSRFSRGTVLNTLKQSGINILRGKKDATTFPDKPVS